MVAQEHGASRQPRSRGAAEFDLARQNGLFETMPPAEILRWVNDTFAPDAVLTVADMNGLFAQVAG